MWQSLVTIDRTEQPRRLGGEKRERKKERSKRPQQNRMAGPASIAAGSHEKSKVMIKRTDVVDQVRKVDMSLRLYIFIAVDLL